MLAAVGRSRVLVHPSFHDSGGFVIVEAMASEVPVVTLDIGGPPYLAGSGGLAVDPNPASSVVDRLSAAMVRGLREHSSLSRLALERAKELTWDAIVDTYDAIYSQAGSTIG